MQRSRDIRRNNPRGYDQVIKQIKLASADLKPSVVNSGPVSQHTIIIIMKLNLTLALAVVAFQHAVAMAPARYQPKVITITERDFVVTDRDAVDAITRRSPISEIEDKAAINGFLVCWSCKD